MQSLPSATPETYSTISAATPTATALSNDRLVSFDDNHVTFRWKEYKHPAATNHDA
jgi:hypothetical protein